MVKLPPGPCGSGPFAHEAFGRCGHFVGDCLQAGQRTRVRIRICTQSWEEKESSTQDYTSITSEMFPLAHFSWIPLLEGIPSWMKSGCFWCMVSFTYVATTMSEGRRRSV